MNVPSAQIVVLHDLGSTVITTQRKSYPRVYRAAI
jgi:hypothetical protein